VASAVPESGDNEGREGNRGLAMQCLTRDSAIMHLSFARYGVAATRSKSPHTGHTRPATTKAILVILAVFTLPIVFFDCHHNTFYFYVCNKRYHIRVHIDN
jgi:hypothetical protein